MKKPNGFKGNNIKDSPMGGVGKGKGKTCNLQSSVAFRNEIAEQVITHRWFFSLPFSNLVLNKELSLAA